MGGLTGAGTGIGLVTGGLESEKVVVIVTPRATVIGAVLSSVGGSDSAAAPTDDVAVIETETEISTIEGSLLAIPGPPGAVVDAHLQVVETEL